MCIICIFTFFYNLKLKLNFFIFTFLILYYIELSDYWYINSMLLNLNIYSENFNNLLINSINKYHPLLLYISIFVFYFTILLFYYFLKKPNYFLFLKIQIFIKFFIQNYIKYIIFSLFLGSFWALQEGSWGG